MQNLHHDHFISTNKYRLSIVYRVDTNKITIFFYSKINNSSPVVLYLHLPDELVVDGIENYWKIRRFRVIRIEPTVPSVTLLLDEKERVLFFKNIIMWEWEIMKQMKEY